MKACEARVYPPGAFQGWRCQNRAKWWVTFRDGRAGLFCGVHVRKYRGNPALVVEAIA